MNPKELRELLDKATPIWGVPSEVQEVGKSRGQTHVFHATEIGRVVATFADYQTARAYIAAVNALPALLAVYEAAEAMLAEMYPVCGADARAKWIIDGNSTAPASLKAALDAAREAK
jgi:hypothetical protein